MLCYCREADGSSLTGRFMTIVEQRHGSAKALKKCFPGFLLKTFVIFVFFDVKYKFLRILRILREINNQWLTGSLKKK